jgi:hypothetical protein
MYVAQKVSFTFNSKRDGLILVIHSTYEIRYFLTLILHGPPYDSRNSYGKENCIGWVCH